MVLCSGHSITPQDEVQVPQFAMKDFPPSSPTSLSVLCSLPPLQSHLLPPHLPPLSQSSHTASLFPGSPAPGPIVRRWMTAPQNPQNPWMLLFVAEKALQKWLRLLKREDYPGLSWWAQTSCQTLYDRDTGECDQKKAKQGWKPGERWYCEGTSEEQVGLWQLQVGRKQILPWSL